MAPSRVASKMPLPRRRIAPPPRAVSQEHASHGERPLHDRFYAEQTSGEHDSLEKKVERLRARGLDTMSEAMQLLDEQMRRGDALQRDNERLAGELRMMEATTTEFRKRLAQISELATTGASAPLASAPRSVCVICEEGALEVALIPCGHRVTCKKCGKACGSRCPICRETVTGMLRVYDL